MKFCKASICSEPQEYENKLYLCTLKSVWFQKDKSAMGYNQGKTTHEYIIATYRGSGFWDTYNLDTNQHEHDHEPTVYFTEDFGINLENVRIDGKEYVVKQCVSSFAELPSLPEDENLIELIYG